MFETIFVYTGLDDFAIVQIIALSGLCGFIVSQLTQSWIFSIFANIGLLGSAVLANVVQRKYGFAITYNKDVDGIIVTSIGLISLAVLCFSSVLFFSWLSNRVGASAQELRARSEAEASREA